MTEQLTSNGMLAPWTYTSEELFQLESKVLFRRQWMLVGHQSDLPQPGDYLTFEVAGERVVVIRDDAGELHAFHNVCRHRGSRVVAGRQGHCGRVIRCPFHGWTYHLNGGLKSVPRPAEFPELDKRQHGLVPIALETWHGLIFLKFEGSSPTVAEQLAAISDEVAQYRLADMQPWGRETEETVTYNWKFFHDVDNEGYHVAAAHPALQELYGRTYQDSLIGDIPFSSGIVDDHPARNWSVARYKSLLPQQSHLPEKNRRLWLYFGIFPNAVIYFYPEKAGFYMSLPAGPESTRVLSREYALPGAGRDQEVSRYLSARIDRVTYQEDLALVHWLQEAAHTSVFPMNNLSDLEIGVLEFHQRLKAQIPSMSLVEEPAPGSLARVNADMSATAA
jgi:phenylpropionate dioxygenase-like ring-hydroxylating dioxygenase large terminal subunit|tara:strand:+ start:5454 stop:6626 length:1173 start_codon:yes stop_codon:yes gene_type:complete